MANPICNFNKTKETLRQLGIQVDDVSGYKPIEGIDVGIRDIRDNISFEQPSGIIIYTDEKGQKHQGFMYMRNYDLELHPEGPVMHTCKCRTLEEYDIKFFRFAETAQVLVYDKSTRSDVLRTLRPCKNCKVALANNPTLRRVNSSVDFAALIAEINREQAVNLAKDSDVDVFGYTRNWHEISEKIRSERNYKCEKCGIQITNTFDRQYIHVHHKNGIKTDNSERNLQCLCIDCHSKIDDLHKENFSYGAKKMMLQEFINKYKSHNNNSDDLPF